MQKKLSVESLYIERLIPHIKTLSPHLSCLRQPAEEAGLEPRYLTIYFPHGMKDFLSAFQAYIDQKMVHNFTQKLKGDEGVFGKIWLCMTERFQVMKPHRHFYQQLHRLRIHPPFLSLSTRLLYKTVDTIWYLAGDNATDFNYYTKRFSLYYVYARTLFYWLSLPDEADLEMTFSYMKERFAETKKLPQLKDRFKEHFPFQSPHSEQRP